MRFATVGASAASVRESDGQHQARASGCAPASRANQGDFSRGPSRCSTSPIGDRMHAGTPLYWRLALHPVAMRRR